MNSPIQVSDSVEYGPVVRIVGRELADAFDDFATENFYTFYDMGFKDDAVEFCFGQLASMERVKEVVERFSTEDEYAVRVIEGDTGSSKTS